MQNLFALCPYTYVFRLYLPRPPITWGLTLSEPTNPLTPLLPGSVQQKYVRTPYLVKSIR